MRPKISVIISLTSYPGRIPTLHLVIESLLAQTVKADKIVLWLAKEEFPHMEKELPKQLLEMKTKGLEIQWYHNIKSYKKLIPSLLKYPDCLIITVDDDAIYQNDIVERLLKAYIQNPNMIHTLRAHGIILENRQIILTKLKNQYSRIDFSITFTFFSIKKNYRKISVKILGIPIWKVKFKTKKTKYYLFGIPVLKIKKPVK